MPSATLERRATRNGSSKAAAIEIAVAEISPSPTNPRHDIDLALDELGASMQEYGLLQPVVVRSNAAGYELIDGHRRYAAALELGWKRIPAVVRDEPDDDQAYLLQLTANLQREDLSPREESAALEVLVREWGWTTRQVAAAINRSHSYVSRRLRVFDDPALASLVISDKLSVSVAEELLRVPDGQQRKALAKQAAREGWERSVARAVVADEAADLVRGVPDMREAGRKVIGLIRELRGVLEAVAIDDLPPTARTQLRRFWQDLAPPVDD